MNKHLLERSLKQSLSKIILVLVCILLSPSVCRAGFTEDIIMEADYILSCQYISDPGNDAYGAINNIYGAPTWVVPGENAIAIMGLVTASDILGDNTYRNRAELTADYLIKMQDASDGAWYDQYSYATAVDTAKSLRHTAEIMIALDKLGYRADRYDSMKKAAQFILDCQDTANKLGNDDGLVAGGKQSDGTYHTWRWTSDNAFSYQGLQAAAIWARLNGDDVNALIWEEAAAEILSGINTYLFVPDDHWVRVIDKDGNVVSSEDRSDWISYAPLMLDLPLAGVDIEDIGEWIHTTLQESDGAVVWDDGTYSDRKSPGYSFQASLAWLDTGQTTYANSAVAWAEGSSLWQTTPDGNGITGGWRDWVDGEGNMPNWWDRFIDTSSYYIMVQNGGYDFNPSSAIPEPATIILLSGGILGIGFFKGKKRL